MTLPIIVDFILKLLILAITSGVAVIAWFLKDIFNQHRGLADTVSRHADEHRRNLQRIQAEATRAILQSENTSRDFTSFREVYRDETRHFRARLDRQDNVSNQIQVNIAAILAAQESQLNTLNEVSKKLDQLVDLRERLAKLESRKHA